MELQSLSRSLVSTAQLKHLNFSTELEHALKIVTSGSAKRRSVRTEYKSASKTLHCKTSWTQGFDGVRWGSMPQPNTYIANFPKPR